MLVGGKVSPGGGTPKGGGGMDIGILTGNGLPNGGLPTRAGLMFPKGGGNGEFLSPGGASLVTSIRFGLIIIIPGGGPLTMLTATCVADSTVGMDSGPDVLIAELPDILMEAGVGSSGGLDNRFMFMKTGWLGGKGPFTGGGGPSRPVGGPWGCGGKKGGGMDMDMEPG